MMFRISCIVLNGLAENSLSRLCCPSMAARTLSNFTKGSSKKPYESNMSLVAVGVSVFVREYNGLVGTMPVLTFFATCKAADDKGTSESGFSVKGRLFCFGFTSALTCGLPTYLGLELKSQGE